MASTNVIYEQPLNEHVRFCLRLEYLFQKIKYYIDDDSVWSSRMALESILEAMNIADRPDLRTKLSKALIVYNTPLQTILKNMEKQQGEQEGKRLLLLSELLNDTIEKLNSTIARIGQPLRENEFIASILQRHASAGGTSPFSTPAYHLWLAQPAKIRIAKLNNWFEHFTELKAAVTLLLKLIRESSGFEDAMGMEGFYQVNLDPKLCYQMVRIVLPANLLIYPEVSVGRHRLSMHFYDLNTEKRPKQFADKVEFQLACCKV